MEPDIQQNIDDDHLSFVKEEDIENILEFENTKFEENNLEDEEKNVKDLFLIIFTYSRKEI